MAGQSQSFIAGEDIETSLFVKQSTTADFHVLKAGDAERVIGVSHEGSREAPIPGITPLAAKQNEALRVYGPGEICEVKAGAAVVRGAYVTPDANAKAVTAAAGEEYGGRALASVANADEMLRILVVVGELET